jgi:hypothetical protein
VESKTDNNETVTRITAKLETWSVPMDVRVFSRKEYREVFPQGTVKTPVGEVKIGKTSLRRWPKRITANIGGLSGLCGRLYLIP